MEVTEITVSASRGFNHPYEDYSNLKPFVSLKASLSPGEDYQQAVKDLQAKAECLVDDHKQVMLASLKELHDLDQAQRETIGLERELTRAQARLKEIREENPRLLEFDRESSAAGKAVSHYIPMGKWAACGEPFDPDELKGRACFAGLHFDSPASIAAFVMAFTDEGLVKILPRFWIAGNDIELRAKKDDVPYDRWMKEGYISAPPGDVLDYDVIKADIVALGTAYGVEEIAFDRWGAIQITQQLQEKGFKMVMCGMGFRGMSAPTKELLSLIQRVVLRHGGNPVLSWMADDMVVMTDAAGNVKPDVTKSTGCISGIVALIIALDRLLHNRGVQQNLEVWEK